MTAQITLQLYTIRELLEDDFQGTLRKIADIGFSCVEPAGYHDLAPTEVAKIFRDFNLSAPSAHSLLPIGDDKNEIIETALQLGHRYLITGSPPDWKSTFNTSDDIKRIAELYATAAENAAAHGLEVGYHNHDWDLAEIDGTPAYQTFLANTPKTVLWEADTFWIARAGIDPVAFLEEIGSRGKVLHFKDGHLDNREIECPYLPAGTGDVDLIAASKAAVHAEYIAVELDAYTGDMMQAVEQSYDYLTKSNIAGSQK